MKKALTVLYSTLLFVIPTLGGISSAFAQGSADSVRITHTQEAGTLEKQRFIDRYDYVFMTKEPTKWMLKGYLSASPVPRLQLRGPSNEISGSLPSSLSYAFGYEHKIGSSFSIDVGLSGGYINDFQWSSHFASAEIRWFYDMKKRLQKGLQANNLTGSYIGFKYGQAFEIPSIKFVSTLLQVPFIGNQSNEWYKNSQIFVLKLGTQKRFFERGFADFSLNIGRTTYDLTLPNQSSINIPAPKDEWFLFSDVKFGLGFTSAPKTTALNASNCNVWKCFKEENQLFKINIASPFTLTNRQFNFSLPISYERKIAKSAWSINTELNLSFSYLSRKALQSFGSQFLVAGSAFLVQPRYYYNLKKRIREGKSANNLSGNYFAIMGSQLLSFSDMDYNPVFQVKRETHWSNTRAAYATWGMQRRIFEKGFFDFQLGLLYKERSTTKNQPIFEPYSSFKLGFAL